MSEAMPQFGTLHLIPVPISESGDASVLPGETCRAAQALRHFVVENARSARRALKELGHPGPLADLIITELPALSGNIAATEAAWADLLAPLAEGISIGLLSEAGCPGIADPGAGLVAWAQARAYPVIPHVGPSSVLLALMGSGLEGQRFSFHGYLPVDATERKAAIRKLEERSGRDRASQLLIETPYRNGAMCAALLEELQPESRLTIAVDLTGKQQSLLTRRVSAWRLAPPDLPRLPTVFAFQAVPAAVKVKPAAPARPAAGPHRPRPNRSGKAGRGPSS